MGPDATWHDILKDGELAPSIMRFKSHLREMGVHTILFVPMLVAGRVTGFIGIRFTLKRGFRQEEIELTRALAHQATLAMQLTRLSAQGRRSAVMAERNRMARDIHDTLAQGFTGVIVQLEAVEEAMSQNQAVKASGHLNRAGDLARESLREARRSVQALRPQALEEKPLSEALKELIEKMTAGTTVQAEFTLRGQPRELPEEWEANILRIGQEVLTNVLRHARASEFRVLLAFEGSEICLEMRDNGCGFDPRRRHEGFGLQGMIERAEGMGGQISIQSGEGKGTAISIILPLTTDSESDEP
jgi:signal transduction histidine kinase